MHPQTIPHANGAADHATPRLLTATPTEADHRDAALAVGLQPLLVDIVGLSKLLSRSVASLARDDAAGRIPAAVRICGSKRWRLADIQDWVMWSCPARREFEARKAAKK